MKRRAVLVHRDPLCGISFAPRRRETAPAAPAVEIGLPREESSDTMPAPHAATEGAFGAELPRGEPGSRRRPPPAAVGRGTPCSPRRAGHRPPP
jgi:hypothetical protein